MRRRRRMSRSRSKRSFRKGLRTKKLNMRARPMRGGFRL